MYVATHGTDDPTLATLPFLVATGAGSAETDCCIALLGEAASVVKPGTIDAIHGVGFPSLRELVEKVEDFGIPVYGSRSTSEARARSPVG
jgi:predicted peroxiredoxin